MSKWFTGFVFLDLPDDFGTVNIEPYQVILFAVIAGAVMLGFMVWGGISAIRVFFLHKSKSEDFPEDFEVELPPLSDMRAVVTQKDAQIVHTGTDKMPSHYIRCRVLFTLENNETRLLEVPQEAFERMYKNQIGTLVLQGEDFFDFSID